MAIYSVYQDGGHYTDIEDDLTKAIAVMEFLATGYGTDGNHSCFTVQNEDGYLLACATNRRIEGQCFRQPSPEDAASEEVERVFDATDAVLRMGLDEIRSLQDHHQSTTDLGFEHIAWDGPHQVVIVESICAFFGVGTLEEITNEALLYAYDRLNPEEGFEKTVMLTIKVKLHMAPGTTVSMFAKDLRYTVTSNTVGVTVADTDLVGCA